MSYKIIRFRIESDHMFSDDGVYRLYEGVGPDSPYVERIPGYWYRSDHNLLYGGCTMQPQKVREQLEMMGWVEVTDPSRVIVDPRPYRDGEPIQMELRSGWFRMTDPHYPSAILVNPDTKEYAQVDLDTWWYGGECSGHLVVWVK